MRDLNISATNALTAYFLCISVTAFISFPPWILVAVKDATTSRFFGQSGMGNGFKNGEFDSSQADAVLR